MELQNTKVRERRVVKCKIRKRGVVKHSVWCHEGLKMENVSAVPGERQQLQMAAARRRATVVVVRWQWQPILATMADNWRW